MRKTPVPYDYLIIVRKILSEKPEVFINDTRRSKIQNNRDNGEKRDTVLAKAEGLRALQR